IEFEGNSAFWTLLENSGSVGGDYPKSLIYPSISKIDLASAEIGEFVKFGTVKDKPTYFLQNKFPFISNPADHSLIYLGVDKPGRVFWFGKVTLE
ncbi:MAG: hypothetical protein IAF38_18985, partial [Bacteroidia bacterium]|nr:hypothetical protein [Bacteroidia bacterium]